MWSFPKHEVHGVKLRSQFTFLWEPVQVLVRFSLLLLYRIIELKHSNMGFCQLSHGTWNNPLFFSVIRLEGWRKHKFTSETSLVLCIWISWTLSLVLFLFGWTAPIHRIVSLISEISFTIGQFNFCSRYSLIKQCAT